MNKYTISSVVLLLLVVASKTSGNYDHDMHGSTPPANNFTVPPALIFTSLDDTHDTVGLIIPRSSTLASAPGGLKSPKNDSIAVYTGILANATFEIYTLEHSPMSQPSSTLGGLVINRYLSTDLRTYEKPTVALSSANSNFTNVAIAKNNITGSYMLMVFEPILDDTQNRSKAVAHASKDGVQWKPTGGSYMVDADCQQTGLLFHPSKGWLSFQRTLQKLTTPKPYVDSVGAEYRRVVQVLSSKDGVTWTKSQEMLEPGVNDPPELELGVGSFGHIPFWYPVHGAKLAAIATNYMPSPSLVNPAKNPPKGVSNVTVGIRADGPVSGQEWWIASKAGAADPTKQTSWLRPYTHQTMMGGVNQMAAAPLGFVMTHAPLMVAQTVMPTPGWPADGMFWLWKGQWLGLMNWRVGGIYSPGNSVFTTDIFSVPSSYLWLDMDSRWGTTPTNCDASHWEQCQAYIMVELLPPTSNTPIIGYEKENSTMIKVHASEQGMPLTWKPTPKPLIPGQLVRARIYLREATVFAIGGGNSWENQLETF